LNLQRYVGSNPLRYTDPSGLTAAIETATTRGGAAGNGMALANIGMRLNCILTAVSAAVDLAGTPDLETLDVIIAGGETAMACGAKAKYKKNPKTKKSPCQKKSGAKCFAAGTLVHTREGLKPIEEIIPGDEVKSMDPTTGEIAYKKVLNTHINRFDPTGTVSLVDETDGSETYLSVTAEHPFYHAEKGWVHASKLVAGDILTEDDGGILRVTGVIFDANAPINTTYNLEVADFHTYFVGVDGVLSHNGFGPRQRMAIQAAADAIGRPIHLVGSKAAGTDGPFSDFDFIIDGCTNRKQRTKAKWLLPKGYRGNQNRGIDILEGPLDPSKPHITFYPRAGR